MDPLNVKKCRLGDYFLFISVSFIVPIFFVNLLTRIDTPPIHIRFN